MSTKLRDVLPPGTWLFVGKLPMDVTKQQLSEYFTRNNVPLPPEAIYLRRGPRTAFAFVSFPTETMLDLVRWAVNDQPFEEDGEPPLINLPDYAKPERQWPHDAA